MSKAQLLLEKLFVPTDDSVKLKRAGFTPINSKRNSEDGADTYAYKGGAHHILHYRGRDPKEQFHSISKTAGETKRVSHPNMEAAIRRIKRTIKASKRNSTSNTGSPSNVRR